MRQGTIVTVPSDGFALSVMEAKRQLRIEPENTDEEDHIADLCAAAHRRIERELGYPILRQTLQTHLTGFPRGAIWLGGGDTAAVVSITYIDANGDPQTLAPSGYRLNAVGRIAEVYRAPNTTWPRVQCQPGAVVIEWTAGWLSPTDVPEDLIHAMKLLVGHWDSNREAVVVGSIASEVQETLDDLIYQFRVPFVA